MTTVSLTQAAGFKANAATFHHAPAEPFMPEDVRLDVYGFVPWVRAGLAGNIAGVDASGRANINVAITLVADTGAELEVTQPLSLYGPGDVLGIDPRQIVRREPPPGAPPGDASTLAHIEFDRPELPWLYTPEAPIGDRLRPWIALVVVEASKVTLMPPTGELPASLVAPITELPPLGDSWAWAHAQVHGSIAGIAIADRLTDAYAAQNLSRLVCPRQLEDNCDYIACVVPTFESGRRVGLGLNDLPNQNGLAPAWGGGSGDVTLPVYDHWRFTTSASANFEALARKLKAVPAPREVGRRTIDTSTPGGRLDDAPLSSPGAIQSIACALYSPAPPPPPDAGWNSDRITELRNEINALADINDDLPRVGPRVYARFQRGAAKVPGLNAGDWFTQLNLSVVDRIAAGLGSRVVAHDQEKLVEAAWAQVGEIDKANREINRLQFGRFVAEAMIAKTLAKLDLGPLMQIAHPVFGKLPFEDGRTIAATIMSSATPWAATAAAFRGLTAANSKLSRTVALLNVSAAQQSAPFATLIADTAGLKDMRRVFSEPDSVAGLSLGAIETLPLESLARVLSVSVSTARVTAVERLGNFTSAATRLSAPRASWTVKSGTFDAGKLAEDQLRASRGMERDLAKLSPGRREAFGSHLARIAEFAPVALAERIDARLVELSIADEPPRGGRPWSRRGENGPWTGHDESGQRRDRDGNGQRRGRDGTGPQVRIDVGEARRRFLKFDKRDRDVRVVGTTSFAELADRLAGTLAEFGTSRLPSTPSKPVAPEVTKAARLAPLAPGLVATKIIKARLGTSIGALVPGDWFDNGKVDPIMAAPHFDRPMYEALEDYDKEWLVANLANIQQSDFVTLLVSNAQFIEAFMVGLSDEMGRELLWRGFPTDQRGTYFRRFWNPASDELKPDIAAFLKTPLGSHFAGGVEGRVVMLVKGDLIRRYPNAMFMAVRGRFLPDKTEFENLPKAGEPGSVAFMARLADDTLIVGLNLTLDDVDDVWPDAGAWWFLIAEHPSAPRFGLDVKETGSASGTTTLIDDLDSQDLPMTGRFLNADGSRPPVSDGSKTFIWGSDSASVARILLQNPARAAFNAKALTEHAR